ncbi:uncharacterized protein LOC100122167 [Nasonia vitripennis]|uniref:Uncharacterized protein n=2 Tax=Nasonia vitripennis TaxID=7425 RepID=A0A7M7QZU9_NASVI|nr:uncharacterized protein LOC100122167 [Nasonia vitripennis]
MIESGADTSLVAAADRARIIPNDGLLDTFAICMLKKYNILHKDGSVNQDHDSYTIFSDNPDVYRISERCKAKIGKDAGETARKIMNCFAEDGDSLLPYSTHPPPTPC